MTIHNYHAKPTNRHQSDKDVRMIQIPMNWNQISRSATQTIVCLGQQAIATCKQANKL